MIKYSDIADMATWQNSQQESELWLSKTHGFVFLGDFSNMDPLFINICTLLQCKKTTTEVIPSKIFGIIFTTEPKYFFATGSSNHLQKILYCPSIQKLRENGAFKKTFWQYIRNLDMI